MLPEKNSDPQQRLGRVSSEAAARSAEQSEDRGLSMFKRIAGRSERIFEDAARGGAAADLTLQPPQHGDLLLVPPLYIIIRWRTVFNNDTEEIIMLHRLRLQTRSTTKSVFLLT